MKKSLYMLAILTFVFAIAITGTGCKKAVAPAPAATPPAVEPEPAPPPTPAPTISLSASPSAIERGESSTLSWRTSNASEVTISGGIGTVSPTGSRSVSPDASTTYRATASGPGGVADAEARVTVTAPPAPPPPPRELSDVEFWTTKVKDVFFDFDRYDIRQDARQILMGNARALAERRHLRFTIEGHCDERGSERYNLALGDKRANAARDFLISQGVSAGRIDTISYGEERPFREGSDEAAWAQNRRAHFVLR